MRYFPKKIKFIFFIITILEIGLFFNFLIIPVQAITKPVLQINIPTISLSESACEAGEDCSIPWIGEYIGGIYKYAINIVGILAVVVLMFGGAIWLTAGGNASRVTEAKAWVGASLTGLVLVLCSYMIMNIINPNLIKLGSIGIQGVKLSENEKSGETGESIDTCDKYAHNQFDIIDFNTTDSKPIQANCQTPNVKIQFKTLLSNGDITEEEMRRLVAISSRESDCNFTAQNNTDPSNPDCGLMQLNEATAKSIDPQADCNYLKTHPRESILIAAKYLKRGEMYWSRGTNRLANIFAYYNGGAKALARSVDCPNMGLAYECCKNAGDYGTLTQPYVFDTIKFYNRLNAEGY